MAPRRSDDAPWRRDDELEGDAAPSPLAQSVVSSFLVVGETRSDHGGDAASDPGTSVSRAGPPEDRSAHSDSAAPEPAQGAHLGAQGLQVGVGEAVNSVLKKIAAFGGGCGG